MTNSDKKIKELEIKLSNKNASIVVAAIDSLRNQAPFPGVIKLLAGLHDSSDSAVVTDHVRNFMNDLKYPSARSEVIEEIESKHSAGTITMLASSCWQSGLDYSPWAANLAKVFCKSDYPSALECFTIIEESAHSLSSAKKKEIIEILKENDDKKDAAKSVLLREMVSILS